MTDEQYLKQLLKSQDLKDDSSELKTLEGERKNVEKVLRDGFPDSSPTIRYGGSKAKGTLIKENYDLDLACYFANDDTDAGETLKDIYDNAAKVLEENYSLIRKRTALRLTSKKNVDFHIDVVPGRFTDDTNEDCFLHQEGSDKDRLKTNPQVHLDHIRDSGFVEAIRVLKLWKTRRALSVKQFAFELLIIDLLEGTTKSLPDQVKHVWTEFKDRDKAPTVEDPANPSGNDLSDMFSDGIWSELSSTASTTLTKLGDGGWKTVFGELPADDEGKSEDSKAKSVREAAAAVATPSRPWAQNK